MKIIGRPKHDRHRALPEIIPLSTPSAVAEDKKFDQFTMGGDAQVGDIVVGLRSSDLENNYQFTFPGNGLRDGDGNYLFKYSSAGEDAVNYPLLLNSTEDLPVVYGVDGGDANISVSLQPKGSGLLYLDGTQWPVTHGTLNQALVSNGSNVLTFTGVLLLSGGTLTGPLILNADPTVPLQAATKQYVDESGGFINLPAGGPITASDKVVGVDVLATEEVAWLWSQAVTFMNHNVQLDSYNQVTGVTSLSTKTPSDNSKTIAAMVNAAVVNSFPVFSDNVGTLTNSGLRVDTGTGDIVYAAGTLETGSPILPSSGGTGQNTLTTGEILVGQGTSPVAFISALTNGQFPVGVTGGIPVPGTFATTATITPSYNATTHAWSFTSNLVIPVSTAEGGTGLVSPTVNNVLITNGASPMNLIHLNDGQLLIGSTAGSPVAATLTAGANVAITNASGSITISTSGAIPPGGGGTGLTNPAANNLLITNGPNPMNLLGLNNGQLVIGATGGAPAAASLTAGTNMVVTPGVNSLTVATVNPIPASTGGTGISSPTANNVLVTNGGGAMSLVHLNDGQLLVGSTAGSPAAASVTAGTNIVVTPGSNSLTIGTVNPIPASTGGTGISSPTANDILVTNGASAMSLIHLNDGQLLIGSTAGAPIGATLTAGANVTITNAANTITVAVPNAATITGATVVGHLPIFNNTSGQLIDGGISTGGLTGTFGNMIFKTPSDNTFGTAAMVAVATTVNNIATYVDTAGTLGGGYGAANPLTAAIGGTGVASPTANDILITNGASAMTPVHLNDGQVLIGATSGAPIPASLTAGANITITPGVNTITIAASASPITLPLAASNGGTGISSPTANEILITNGASAMNLVGLTDGQLLIGATGNAPTAASLTAGSNITITPGANSITIAAASGGTPVLTDTGTLNTLICAYSGYTTYTKGDTFVVFPNNTNSGACTINIQGVGVVNLIRDIGNLIANEIFSNVPYEITYNGTAFVVLNPSPAYYGCTVFLGTPQALVANTITTIQFSQIESDVNGLYNTTTFQFLPKRQGWYSVKSFAEGTAGGANANGLTYLYVNNILKRICDAEFGASTSRYGFQIGGTEVLMNNGDNLVVRYQALNSVAGAISGQTTAWAQFSYVGYQ